MAEKGTKISYRSQVLLLRGVSDAHARPTVCNVLCIYSVGMYDIHGLQPDQDIQDIQYN